VVNNDRHEKVKRKLVLLRSKRPLKTLCTKGFRPNYQTTQYDGLVTSHCITLILICETIKLQGKSQNRENWGLFAHQPPIGLQYATICSTNNTNTEHKYAPRCDHGPAALPAAAASIMDNAIVSMEPQMVLPCLLPMIRRTPPPSHLLCTPPSSHSRFH
jgi:hypothetical protein